MFEGGEYSCTIASAFGPEAYVEQERARQKQEYRKLMAKLRYLRQVHYVEMIKEGETRLYRLTAKGKYELLKLQFIEHMAAQRKKKWDRAWRVIIFDIPEYMRKYRDHLRGLLKDNQFEMWQLSVWVTKYNPEPALQDLLKYLGLQKHYAIIQADCAKCSPRVIKVWKQMRRKKDNIEDVDLHARYWREQKRKYQKKTKKKM